MAEKDPGVNGVEVAFPVAPDMVPDEVSVPSRIFSKGGTLEIEVKIPLMFVTEKTNEVEPKFHCNHHRVGELFLSMGIEMFSGEYANHFVCDDTIGDEAMYKGKRVTLRAVELEDIPDILRHFNDIEVRRFLHMITPVSAEEEEKWIQSLTQQRRACTAYVFAMELQKPKKFLGICGLLGVDSIHRSAELGIALQNKRYWGKGLGTEAIRLLLDFGFNIINLHRIYLTVFEDNLRAQRVYEKVGFTKTGRQRDAIRRFGRYFDLLSMDLLADEYRKSKSIS